MNHRGANFMLIGPIEAGKTTLFNALYGRHEPAAKTQVIEFQDHTMDTPGEYLSHPRMYSALIQAASDVETLVYVHPCNEMECRLPPGFLSIYDHKDIICVITKTDLPHADPDRTEQMLREQGLIGSIFRVSSQDPESMLPLRDYLLPQEEKKMKRLITAATIRAEHQAGKTQIAVHLPTCIITPEARTVADELGFGIVEAQDAATATTPVASASALTPVTSVSPPIPTNEAIAQIRSAVLAQLPANISTTLVDQIIQKIMNQQNLARPSGLATKAIFQAKTLRSGIKHIAGSSVQMERFTGSGDQIGIADFVGTEDGSSIAAGFMGWENEFFPWTLTYDEVDLVLEGELHIRCQGETVIGKAGDVIFIPKDSSIEFGTPNHVRFLYVAYPANWQS